jgi:hypothetical protein
MLSLWTGSLNFVKMTILRKLIYRVNAIPTKIAASFKKKQQIYTN